MSAASRRISIIGASSAIAAGRGTTYCRTSRRPRIGRAAPTLSKGTGCRACRQTGFRGRTGIHELMVMTDPLREMVVSRVNAAVIRHEAMKSGMKTLRQDGWRKVLMGQTTVDEVARVTAGDVVF